MMGQPACASPSTLPRHLRLTSSRWESHSRWAGLGETSPDFTSSSICRMTARASPTMGTSTGTLRQMLTGSMSTLMKRMSRFQKGGEPKPSSPPSAAPTAMTQSARRMARWKDSPPT